MQVIRKNNTGTRFFLCVINIYKKYSGFVPLKDQKVIIITNSLKKTLNESDRKPNKI